MKNILSRHSSGEAFPKPLQQLNDQGLGRQRKSRMIIILIILLALYLISFILSSRNSYYEKLTPYECGLEPIGDARIKFKIIYYMIGILYLLFDLEIIFIYPLAVSIWLINSYIGFIYILIFIILLTLGFIYEWFTGSLDVS
jgi:NADH-quinone oxidoreductase subunit A